MVWAQGRPHRETIVAEVFLPGKKSVFFSINILPIMGSFNYACATMHIGLPGEFA